MTVFTEPTPVAAKTVEEPKAVEEKKEVKQEDAPVEKKETPVVKAIESEVAKSAVDPVQATTSETVQVTPMEAAVEKRESVEAEKPTEPKVFVVEAKSVPESKSESKPEQVRFRRSSNRPTFPPLLGQPALALRTT